MEENEVLEGEHDNFSDAPSDYKHSSQLIISTVSGVAAGLLCTIVCAPLG
jgi:hypothetical protein